jgi:photosystem II stability/assembly factor-like uncharacterized protein
MKISYLIICINLIHSPNIISLTYEDSDSTRRVQLRRGKELQEGYQSYTEKYAGKNLYEEKRSLFPLRGETVVGTELNPKVPRVIYAGINFVNKDTGWASGDLVALIKTIDGGKSWNKDLFLIQLWVVSSL